MERLTRQPTMRRAYGFTRVEARNFASRNSRPLIAQTPLLSATKAYGQFLGQDLNLLDSHAITANGQVLLFAFY